MKALLFVDNVKRDLLTSLLLAARLDEFGISSVITPWNLPEGYLEEILFSFRPDCVVLSQARRSTHHVYALSKKFTDYVYIHESEGVIYNRELISTLKLFSPHILADTKGVFTWGAQQICDFKELFNLPGANLIDSGSVRLEALSLIKSIVQTSKINTLFAFSSAAPAPRFNTAADELRLTVQGLGMSLEDYLIKYNFQLLNRERLLAVASRVKGNILLRSHPFGCPNALYKALKEWNINGSLQKDNLLSHNAFQNISLLVHGGSTICMEAAALGIPSITSPSICGQSSESVDFEGFTVIEPTLDSLIASVNSLPTVQRKFQSLSFTNPYITQFWEPCSPSKVLSGKIYNDLLQKSTSNIVSSSRSLLKQKLSHSFPLEVQLNSNYHKKYSSKIFNEAHLDDCQKLIQRAFLLKKVSYSPKSILFFGNKFIPLISSWQKIT